MKNAKATREKLRNHCNHNRKIVTTQATQNAEAACKDKRFANREELNQIQTGGRLFVPFLYRADSCVRLDKHTTNKQTITFSFIVCAFLLRILFETQDRSRNQRQIKKQDGPKTKTVENAEMNIKRLRKHIERHVVQRRLITTPICPRAPVRHANATRAIEHRKSDFNKPLNRHVRLQFGIDRHPQYRDKRHIIDNGCRYLDRFLFLSKSIRIIVDLNARVPGTVEQPRREQTLSFVVVEIVVFAIDRCRTAAACL